MLEEELKTLIKVLLIITTIFAVIFLFNFFTGNTIGSKNNQGKTWGITQDNIEKVIE